MEIGSNTHVGQSSSLLFDDYDATTHAPEDESMVTDKQPVVQETTSKEVLDLQTIVPVTNETIFSQSSVQQGMNHEADGTKQWIPDVPADEKPYVGLRFKSWDNAFNMYKAYAAKAGFDVRKSTSTWTKGVISHKYIVCSKAGSPRCKDVDTLETSSSSSKRRNINIKVTGCNACIRLKVTSSSVGFEIYNFSEAHNHGLVDDFNMDLTRGRRQLQFSEKKFIHCLQTTGFGPTVAHSVQSSLKGGQQLVAGSKTDFKNHARNVRGVIADADAQMIVDSHNVIFVPFTGVDFHKKCVTFGAGLIHNETIDSYKWLLNAFVTSHGKQPQLVLTDQDATMKQAVSTVLTESTHKLCMWHVTNKIPVKGEMQVNEEIRCHVNKLVWNVFIKPETFESRWHQLIDDFNLSENKWLKDMFAIRDRWVPAYIKELTMCCLMKTTFRCESSNSQFKVFHNPNDDMFSCSYKGFTRIGYLCKHIFKVFQIELIDEIPETHIPRRWRSDVLPSSLFKIESRYGAPVDERSKVRQQFLPLANHCADRARGNIDLLQTLVDQMQQMKNNIWDKIPIEPSCNSNTSIIEDLVGYKIPEKVTITPPTRIRNKGSGSHKRTIGPGEKAKRKGKKPKGFCKKCNKHVHGHDSRNHEKIMLLKEQRRKEREKRRKVRDQKRKEKVAMMEKQGREYVKSDETVDTSETDSFGDSDDSNDT
ncbi:protein FAR1-RELATED SEQUENCE 5-like [Bidens hawaiensis]|uniref:protein FAR1-RELATED SEQUENCE 5-like n=1 Tax=Bidens hawaiensis TaxID=980011 RepID=UPI0040498C9C